MFGFAFVSLFGIGKFRFLSLKFTAPGISELKKLLSSATIFPSAHRLKSNHRCPSPANSLKRSSIIHCRIISRSLCAVDKSAGTLPFPRARSLTMLISSIASDVEPPDSFKASAFSNSKYQNHRYPKYSFVVHCDRVFMC